MLGSIFKNSVIYTVANQIPMFANLVLLPFMSEFLNKHDYVVYGLVLAWIGAVSVLGNLGFIVLFQNSFFKDKVGFKEDWKRYLGFLAIYRIFYGALVTALLYAVFRDEVPLEQLPWFLFLIVAPVIFFDMTRTVGMRLCQFRHQHRLVHISTVVTGIITVSVTFLTIYVYEMHYFGWFIAQFVGNAFQFLYFAHFLYYKEKILPTFNVDIPFLRRSLKVALPMMPSMYAHYLLNSSDRVIMDLYKTNEGDVGMYNVAYGFATYFNTFNGQVNTVVSPIYFDMYAKNDERAKYIVRNLTYLWLGFTLCGAFFLSLWSREIFGFLYARNTDGLQEAYKYSVFIFMAFTYRPMFVASMDRAVFLEKTRTILALTTAAGLLNVAINLSLVPSMGINAAILSTFVCYLFLGFSGFYVKEIKQYIELNYHPTLILLLIIAVSGIAWLSMDLAVTYKIGVTFILILLAAMAYVFKGKEMIALLNQYRHT